MEGQEMVIEISFVSQRVATTYVSAKSRPPKDFVVSELKGRLKRKLVYILKQQYFEWRSLRKTMCAINRYIRIQWTLQRTQGLLW